MTSALLLTAWVLFGLVTAARASLPNESRWAWAPVAMILGPLWLTVAREQLAPAAASDNSEEEATDGEEEIDLAQLPPEVRWIHEDHRLIP